MMLEWHVCFRRGPDRARFRFFFLGRDGGVMRPGSSLHGRGREPRSGFLNIPTGHGYFEGSWTEWLLGIQTRESCSQREGHESRRLHNGGASRSGRIVGSSREHQSVRFYFIALLCEIFLMNSFLSV